MKSGRVLRQVAGLAVEALLRRGIQTPADIWERLLRESINEVVREYRDRLTNLVYNAWNRIGNDLSKASVMQTSVRTEHRRMIKDLARSAYVEGMREGGIADPESWIEPDEEKLVTAWIDDQSGYVNEFTKAVAAAQTESERQAILGRVNLWVDALRSLGTQGEMSAKKNLPGTWKFDPNKEHCQAHDGRVSCAWLNGQRHRLKWFLSKGYIPQEKGSQTLGCGGWKCGCKIVGDDGRVLAP